MAGILGPLFWTGIFGRSIGADGGFYFPGLAFVCAGGITLLVLVPVVRVFQKLPATVKHA